MLLVFTAASFGFSIDRQWISASSADKTGEQIFREIIFFEGNQFSLNLPAFRDLTETTRNLTNAQKQERATTVDKIVSLINRQDQGYFNSFKSKILSRNPYTIAEAVIEARIVVGRSLGLVQEFGQIEAFMASNRDRYDLTRDADYARLKSDLRSQYSQSSVNNKMAQLVISTGIVIDSGMAIAIAIVLPMPPVVGASHLFANNAGMLEYESFVRQIISKY